MTGAAARRGWWTIVMIAVLTMALPASGGAVVGDERPAAEAVSVLWPQPREVGVVSTVRLRPHLAVVRSPELKAPAALLLREGAQLFGTRRGVSRTMISLNLMPRELTRPEEYTITPTSNGIVLNAHDEQGAFWAVHTLVTLLGRARRTADGYEVTIPTIRDWPGTPSRAFMIEGAWCRSLDAYKRTLELLARQHITYFALEFGPQVVLDFDPTIAEGGRFTKAQAHEVIEYGRSLGLKPIGYLNLLGHLDRSYQKAPYTQHGGLDIRTEETYEKFVYPILSEMLEVYGSIEYFHCGMDEAWELFTWLSKEGYDVNSLIAQHVARVNSFLKARGVKLVIWHDMLIAPDLENQLGAPVGPANGGPPQNTAAALAMIPKDVTLDYWFYDPLPTYPALDYLKSQGFAVWASPWQTPFSLVRYAQARQAPTMGTLWADPPGCFASPAFSPVTALYAQAAWNASTAGSEVRPVPALAAAAQRAVSAVLWRRRSLDFPGDTALLLTPAGATRQRVAAAKQQFSGVPLATEHPIRLDPLPEESKPLESAAGASMARLVGGTALVLDGANSGRHEDQLILYGAPEEKTGTNRYGCEVAVGADGVVQEVIDGVGDHVVPAGGFVLSAHGGRTDQLLSLRPGDRIGVLDAQGQWIGGSAPMLLHAALPDGTVLRVDGEDTGRGANQLVLYHAGYGDGRTETNQYGVEVVVCAGKVAEVQEGAGNSMVPTDGYVLSVHEGAENAAAALRALRTGDTIRLLLERGGQQQDLAEVLATRGVHLPVGERCSALFLAMSSGRRSSPGTPLGEWQVRYADGTMEHVAARYGREVLSTEVDALPARLDDPSWLVEEGGQRFLVREWTNPRPEREVKELVFVPAQALLETGAEVVAATAATGDRGSGIGNRNGRE